MDAVYNPLLNALHGEWTRAAVAAGKHVLYEKPFTANADEPAEIAAAAASSGRVVIEGFHYRYHPLAARVREILDAREIGRVRRVETWLCLPLPKLSDIRYN
ncbi:MAG: Gfo/Idh/MocA family oxidoreductase, partial [Myxococcales bacterium]|nr:Gfo/Idh/MocA family oxidoreductase [Myxococcales bacterium]